MQLEARQAHILFQSTRPQGARHPSLSALDSRKYFNPRAREGRDYNADLCGSCKRNFNPRAREGRDRVERWNSDSPIYFNPRAREGRDIIQGVQARF